MAGERPSQGHAGTAINRVLEWASQLALAILGNPERDRRSFLDRPFLR